MCPQETQINVQSPTWAKHFQICEPKAADFGSYKIVDCRPMLQHTFAQLSKTLSNPDTILPIVAETNISPRALASKASTNHFLLTFSLSFSFSIRFLL